MLKSCLFISHTPYWFIRTYICLYLFSPVLNKYLTEITGRQRILLIITLSFISIYLGTSHGDSSLLDGKNLANFSLLYVMGNTLSAYKKQWSRWSNKVLIPTYIIFNLLVVSVFCTFADTIISKILWRISFPYCSPLLILNALLFFVIIGKYRLHSKWINYVASSMFAVYLIHCQPFIEENIIGSLINNISGIANNELELSLYTILLGILIMVVCVVIDKCLSPLWKLLYNLL